VSTALEYQPRRVKKPPTPRQRGELRAIASVVIVIVLAFAVVDLWERRVSPYGGIEALGFEFFFLLLILGGSAALLALWIRRIWKFNERWATRLMAALTALVPVLVFTTTCTLNYFEIPFRLAFSLSRTSMERAVVQVRLDPSKGAVAQNVGWLPVQSINVDGASAEVMLKGAEGFETSPFLQWCPAGHAPTGYFYSMESLGNDWYWINR